VFRELWGSSAIPEHLTHPLLTQHVLLYADSLACLISHEIIGMEETFHIMG